MSLCLATGALIVSLSVQSFTLAWMHSVEKVRWEEDWQIVSSTQGPQLKIVEARIKGSGAGMEPPPDSVLRDGWWHYTPQIQPLKQVILTHSPYTQGYELCSDGTCKPLVDFLPGIADTGTIVLSPCRE